MPDPSAPLPSGGGAPLASDSEESELTEGAADSPLLEAESLAPEEPPALEEPGTPGPGTPGTAPKPAAPRPTFKISTFIIVFLGLLGFLMLIETGTRNAIACSLGTWSVAPVSPTDCTTGWGPLYVAIGFQSQHLLATMAIAGAIEMLVTAFAYNYTTDWVKQAKVAKWSGAFRKVQMAAIRSGKKDKIAALRPFQERITRLSSEVTIGQFKGMAITYFMLILMYTWVGLVIANATTSQQTIALGGGSLVLTNPVLAGLPIPWWFLIFSLYTIPFSLVFRRILKHFWVQRYARQHNVQPVAPGSAATGGTA
ncbi:MAG TPA: EMC3/TMCO1 family protein [Thermoplasmata archaeon]|nr:EMC3/TMCO1 family protein [Thermoplasmata archaeon]